MKLSLATRNFLGYAVVLVTFGAVSVFSVAEMHRNQQEIRLVSQGYLHLSQDAAAIETLQKNRVQDTARLLKEQGADARRSLVRLSRLYFPPLMAQRLSQERRRAEELLQLAPGSDAASVKDLVGKAETLEARYREYEAALEQVFAEAERDAPQRAALDERVQKLSQLEAAVDRDVRLLEAAVETRIRQQVDVAEQRERQSGLLIIALSVLAISVGLLATALSARTLRPVRTLTEGVMRVSRGDYPAQLGLKGDDEISVLSREFDAMARSLREREAQLREKQEALLRAEQLAAVGRISAQIAHEVRNPLSSIGLNAELLEESLGSARFSSPEHAREARDVLQAMSREIDRLTEVTEQYLRMARLPTPQLQPEDVNELLDSVLDFSREEMERSGVKLERALDASAPRALLDEGQLRQVFLNLLRNSREAMPGGGQLHVRSRAENGAVEVTFPDTGRGMTPDVKERIFEPFFSTKEGGTGLGLAVSQQIVQAHGGSIRCDSAPGRGTTFVVRLPRA
ncbi:MAG TPA: ATP-binding protein [Myxococcales bacterium]|nr:ATP-binding protein [Myxococcales bacterium]